MIKIIRDNDVLVRASKYVSTQYEKIKQIHIDVNRGTSKGMTNPAWVVEFHLHSVDMFYNRNFIVNDVFSEYIDFCNIGLKALLINYINYKEYSSELYELDYFFCYCFMYYGKYDELLTTIREYNINEISLVSEDAKKLSDVIINYYGSFIGQLGMFGRYEVNHKVHSQISKAPINNKFVDVFDNVSLLLGIVKIEREPFDVICANLLKTIRYTDIFYPSNIHRLEYFIKGNKKNISLDFIKDILEIACEKPRYFIQELLKYISSILIDRADKEKIDDVNLINRIFNVLENKEVTRSSNALLKYLYELYFIVSDQNKAIVVEKINNSLKINFSKKEYWMFVMNNVIPYDIFINEYLHEIKIHTPNNNLFHFSDLTFKSKKYSPTEDIDYTYMNFIRFAYKFDLLSYTSDIKDLFNKKDYLDFYLNPDEFNYQNLVVVNFKLI